MAHILLPHKTVFPWRLLILISTTMKTHYCEQVLFIEMGKGGEWERGAPRLSKMNRRMFSSGPGQDLLEKKEFSWGKGYFGFESFIVAPMNTCGKLHNLECNEET